MPLTTTTASAAIQAAYRPGFVAGLERDGSLYAFFAKDSETSPGDTSRRWLVNYSGNSSTQSFSEGEGTLSPGQQSWVAAYWAYSAFRFLVQISDHARAALRSNYINAIDAEMTLGQQDLLSTINAALSTDLATIVDSTTTYAANARGSATWWESYEASLSSARVAHGDLITAIETIGDSPKFGVVTDIVVSPNQLSNIYAITGQPGMKMFDPSDSAKSYFSQSFAGIPIKSLAGINDNTLYLFDRRPGKWGLVTHQGFEVKDQGRSGGSDVFYCSTMLRNFCYDPKVQGKLTNAAT